MKPSLLFIFLCKKHLLLLVSSIFLVSCSHNSNDNEMGSIIKGRLIEGTTKQPISNVKVSLYDDMKIYGIAFSEEDGTFSLPVMSLSKNRYYSLSFHWSDEYPAKVIKIFNISEVFDLADFVVYDKDNPYGYEVLMGYMIHKTLPGEYTFEEAKAACKALKDGYSDWELPEGDYLNSIAHDKELARRVAEFGWYWSSWIYFGETYLGVHIWDNMSAYTKNPNERLKVLPVRLIEK